MSIAARDILFMAGGFCCGQYGPPWRRTKSAFVGGDTAIQTFTRSSTPKFIGADGLLYTAAANVPRVEFVDLDGDGVREPTLLLEAARTNVLTRSEELDHADWTKSTSTITANSSAAPDGTTTADEIVESAGAGSHSVLQSRTSVNSDQDIALSCYAKALTRSWLRLTIDESGGTDVIRQWYNLATGVLGSSTTDGTGLLRDAAIEPLGNGWYRCILVASPQNGTSTVRQFVGLATADLETSYTGDGSSSALVWGVQAEQDASGASSYIQTVGASATRNADSLSFAFHARPENLRLYARLDRPEYADASGTLSDDFGIASLGSTRPDIRCWFNATTRAVRVSIRPDTSGDQQVTTAIVAGNPMEVLVELQNPETDPRIRVDAGNGFSGLTGASPNPMTSFGGSAVVPLGGNSLVPFGRLHALIVARGSPSFAHFRALL